MATDFPLAPVVGQQHPFTPVPGQPVFIWDGNKWVAAPLTGAVRYDVAQSLTAPQQTQARDNIGASSGAATGAVRYDAAQSLTSTQQTQARTNIYAAPFDALAYSGMQVNGGFEVSQELSSAGTSLTGKYLCDGWAVFFVGPVITAAAVDAVNYVPGFRSVLYTTVSTAKPSLATSDYAVFRQAIEGYRIARLAWGTANAQPITISFWSAHHRTGVYGASIRNGAGNRSYTFTYTQAAADVAQYNIVTIPGDTSGTWTADNTIGITITFCMASGSDFIAPTANVWSAGGYFTAPGQINGVAATSDVFRITGVTVLPGTQAPTAAQSPNIMRPYGDELLTCQRYWQKLSLTQVGFQTTAAGASNWSSYQLHPLMRATPTIAAFGTAPTLTNSTYSLTTTTDREFCLIVVSVAAGHAFISNLQIACNARL